MVTFLFFSHFIHRSRQVLQPLLSHFFLAVSPGPGPGPRPVLLRGAQVPGRLREPGGVARARRGGAQQEDVRVHALRH